MTYCTVEVDVDLSDFDDDDLINEIKTRGLEDMLGLTIAPDLHDLIERIYYLHRSNQTFDNELKQLFYSTLGRIV